MKKLYTTVVLIPAIAISGCTTHHKGATSVAPITTSAPAEVTPPPTPGTESPSPSGLDALRIPAQVERLVPPRAGSGNATLPAFTTKQKRYTIVIICNGGDKVSIRYNGAPDKDSWPCDGAPIYQRVYSKNEVNRLAVEAQGNSAWQVEILSGLVGAGPANGGAPA
jgi:hypothetical protein